MLRSCKYCGRIHNRKFDCGLKPKRNKEITDEERFRNSYAWRKKRDKIKERDIYLCQVCITKLYDIGEREYNAKNLEVHHIDPISETYDKRLDDENLITTCERHHEMAERGDIPREFLKSLVQKRHTPLHTD